MTEWKSATETSSKNNLIKCTQFKVMILCLGSNKSLWIHLLILIRSSFMKESISKIFLTENWQGNNDFRFTVIFSIFIGPVIKRRKFQCMQRKLIGFGTQKYLIIAFTKKYKWFGSLKFFVILIVWCIYSLLYMSAMNWILSPQNSYVVALTPNVTVFRERILSQ